MYKPKKDYIMYAIYDIGIYGVLDSYAQNDVAIIYIL